LAVPSVAASDEPTERVYPAFSLFARFRYTAQQFFQNVKFLAQPMRAIKEFVMSNLHNVNYLKNLTRNLISAKGLHVSKIGHLLNPPIHPATLDRILKNDKPFTHSQHTACTRFCAQQMGCSTDRISRFDANPFDPEFLDLLALAVGQSYSITDGSAKSLNGKLAALEARSAYVFTYDTGWPDDIYMPVSDMFLPEENAVCQDQQMYCLRRSLIMKLSTVKAASRQERHFGFGDQDDEDEKIEALIDAVVTHGFRVGILDDLAPASGQPDVLAPYETVRIFDQNAVLLHRRGAHSFSIISADDGVAHTLVVKSLHTAMELLQHRLCHPPNPSAVVALLEGMLSHRVWRWRMVPCQKTG
jgi:hypothetical protein